MASYFFPLMLDGIHLCLEFLPENTDLSSINTGIRHYIVQMVYLSPCTEVNITFYALKMAVILVLFRQFIIS